MPMSAAESSIPICSSEGWDVEERICCIVRIGQRKLSIPSNRVTQAHILAVVLPRHTRNPDATAKTMPAPIGESSFHASHAPTATTRLPVSALMSWTHNWCMPESDFGQCDGEGRVCQRSAGRSEPRNFRRGERTQLLPEGLSSQRAFAACYARRAFWRRPEIPGLRSCRCRR